MKEKGRVLYGIALPLQWHLRVIFFLQTAPCQQHPVNAGGSMTKMRSGENVLGYNDGGWEYFGVSGP